jgi:hypothetical protein
MSLFVGTYGSLGLVMVPSMSLVLRVTGSGILIPDQSSCRAM